MTDVIVYFVSLLCFNFLLVCGEVSRSGVTVGLFKYTKPASAELFQNFHLIYGMEAGKVRMEFHILVV